MDISFFALQLYILHLWLLQPQNKTLHRFLTYFSSCRSLPTSLGTTQMYICIRHVCTLHLYPTFNLYNFYLSPSKKMLLRLLNNSMGSHQNWPWPSPLDRCDCHVRKDGFHRFGISIAIKTRMRTLKPEGNAENSGCGWLKYEEQKFQCMFEVICI